MCVKLASDILLPVQVYGRQKLCYSGLVFLLRIWESSDSNLVSETFCVLSDHIGTGHSCFYVLSDHSRSGHPVSMFFLAI